MSVYRIPLLHRALLFAFALSAVPQTLASPETDSTQSTQRQDANDPYICAPYFLGLLCFALLRMICMSVGWGSRAAYSCRYHRATTGKRLVSTYGPSYGTTPSGDVSNHSAGNIFV